MSSHKYRVEQDGVFLGHHSGKDMQIVIEKAVSKYGHFYPINTEVPFILTRGQNTFTVSYNG